ncbi:MAG: HYR domain-containing protein [Verrucomicrobia bacterium]|nr:HYR domain-containing protein [Verrucomicrobiota bacterium]
MVGNDPGLCGAVVSWVEPTATDNSTGTNAVMLRSTRMPGSRFALGTTLVTYTATDPSGNRSKCSFSVTVLDTEAPRFVTFPANQTLSLGTNCSVKAPDLTSSVTVSEHCNDMVTVTQSPPANTILALGPNTITIYASDSHTNIAMSNVVVTVVANPPVFVAFPDNQILALESNCSLSVPNLVTNAMAFDTCYNLVTVTQSPPAGVNLAVGVNTITLYAPDTYGNVTTSNVTVTVTANPPIAGAQTAGARTNTAVTLSAAKFLANDISPDGRTMAVVGVTAVSTNGGKVTFNGINSIVYLPPTNYAGLDAFTYTNRDCGGLETLVQVVVTVRATLHVMELDAPDTFSITSLTIAADGVLTLVAEGVPGVTYEVQRSQNLGQAAWTTVAKIIADENGQVIYHEPNAQSPSFYRTKEVTKP